MDIESTIAKITKDYITPLFSVVKVRYFYVHVIFDEESESPIMQTTFKNDLFAVTDQEHVFRHCCCAIKKISVNYINEFEEKTGIVINRDKSMESFIIKDIQRIC